MPRTPIEHLPIIDTHQHLWDLVRFKPPWLALPGEEKINTPSTLREYAAQTAGLNVMKTVYMEVDVAERQQQEEADWVTALCKSGKTVMRAAIVSARPATPGFAKYLRGFAGNPYVKGVRQVLQVPDAKPGLCLTDAYVRAMRLCGTLGKTFDLCMRPAELADGAKLAALCPDTRFVLDHCGNGAARNPSQRQWERDIAFVAKRRNVVCKISGIVKTVPEGRDIAEELRPVVRRAIDVFGPDRVMFGGDWPVCNKTATFRKWVEALDSIVADASESERRRLFHDNAAKWYGI